MALKCTNTSSPLSVVINPNPFASLNHLTVPDCLSEVTVVAVFAEMVIKVVFDKMITITTINTFFIIFIVILLLTDFYHIFSLQSFWSLDHLKGNPVTFRQSSEPFGDNAGVMNEDISSMFSDNKPI